MRLDEDFDQQFDIKDYLSAAPGSNQVASNVQPLPQQPQPIMGQQMPQQQTITQTGLTPTENALLSEEEKQIRLRQRGIV